MVAVCAFDYGFAGISYVHDLGNNPTYPLGRHLDGANYAFTDGHVKWIKGSYSSVIAAATGAPAGVINSSQSMLNGEVPSTGNKATFNPK
jgi:prepilin-type processing-associated H-X9-DG protein